MRSVQVMDSTVAVLASRTPSHSNISSLLGVSKQAVSAWMTGVTPVPRPVQLLAAYVLRDLESQATDLSAGLPSAPPSRQDAATSTIPPPPTLRHVRSAVGPRKPR